MGKKAKEHRKKVAKRNAQIADQKKKQQKTAMDFLMKLIQKEKDKGLFDGPLQPIPNSPENSTDGMSLGHSIPTPIIDSETTTFNGPQI